MVGLNLYLWMIFPAATLWVHHDSELFSGMTHHCLFFLSVPHLLTHQFVIWTSKLNRQWLKPVFSHCSCLSHPPLKLFSRKKVKRADTGMIFHLADYPALSLLDQSHLWLPRKCGWDTVATVHIHVFLLVWDILEPQQHTHYKTFMNQIMSLKLTCMKQSNVTK